MEVKMKFLELFAGIGGFRMGLEMAGHKAVGYIEWDKFARRSYEAIYETEGEFTHGDITTVDYRRLPRADLWAFGFPCQDISVAGKQQGFRGNRSSLFFRVTQLLRQTKEWDTDRLPSYLLIENVKNFFSINNGWDFFAAQVELDEIGYDVEWQLLNSKDFGVPQNRERVFIVGHLRGRSTKKVFPIGRKNENFIEQLANIDQHKRKRKNPQTGRVYSVNGLSPCLSTMQGGGLEPKIILPIITPDRENKSQNGRRFKEPGEPMFTLTAQDRHGIMFTRNKVIKEDVNISNTLQAAGPFRGLGNNNPITGVMLLGNVNPSGNGINRNVYDSQGLSPTLTTNKGEGIKIKNWIPSPEDITRTIRSSGHISTTNKHNFDIINDGCKIRRLTPRETWRLQGFPDWAFDKAAKVNSDSQLYKQAGNAVTVNVAYEIGKRLILRKEE